MSPVGPAGGIASGRRGRAFDGRGPLGTALTSLLRHRRAVAAALLGLAAFAALTALRPPAPPSVSVTVAARDLAGGRVVRPGDLAVVAMTPAAAPDGRLPPAALAGRVLAAPVRRGEAITDLRLVGRALLASLRTAGLVGAPVRLADAGTVALLRPGDTVDVVAVDVAATEGVRDGVGAGASGSSGESAGGALAGATSRAYVEAAGARVVAIPDLGGGSGPVGPAAADTGGGALVVLAVPPPVALALARAAAASRLSVIMRPG